jgi:aryl-alcohol dehydrogenase-like predicted oxidoreductase
MVTKKQRQKVLCMAKNCTTAVQQKCWEVMFGITAHRGWNVIDTASNYRGGRGERAIGYAMTALHEQLGLTREMLFISTKAGFLQDEVKNLVSIAASPA